MDVIVRYFCDRCGAGYVKVPAPVDSTARHTMVWAEEVVHPVVMRKHGDDCDGEVLMLVHPRVMFH